MLQRSGEDEVGVVGLEHGGRGRFGKKAEDAAATTAHGGIEGTLGDEEPFGGLHGWMLGEDTALEVVCDRTGPFADGAKDGLAQVVERTLGAHALVGLAGGDKVVGLDEQEVEPRQIERQGRELVADARGEHGPVTYKEGTVGPEARHKALHGVGREAQAKHVVQHDHGVGSIAAAAAEAGTGGDALRQTYAHGGHSVALVAQQTHGTHDQIVLSRTVDVDACKAEAVVVGRFDVQFVAKWDRVEDGFEVVVTARAALCDVEAEVDFGTRKCFHRAKLSI